MQHLLIAVARFLCVAVPAIAIFKWIERRILLAWLGVKSRGAVPSDPIDRLLLRFQKLRTSIWMFAWLKVRFDPQFRELPAILTTLPPPSEILDVGCGHGMVGGAMLEWCPGAKIVGIDPRKVRVRSASAIFADRGTAIRAAAPEFPTANVPEHFDLILVLDVIHYLTDADLELTLTRLRQRVAPAGTMIIRVSIPEAPSKSLFFHTEKAERLLTWSRACYRAAGRVEQMLQTAGFKLVSSKMSGTGRELCWFIAQPAN